jgi:hypothetical protein
MAGISHASVAAVYDVEPGDTATGREPFYVMELCDGGSLADRLDATGPVPADELVPIVAAVADGLTELHARGLIHRDVKPANILFGGDRAKLADFGIVRDDGRPDSQALTLPGATIGTLPFLAPEVLAGGPPSAASDVYALGVTAFLALTGHAPDSTDTAGRVVTGLGANLDAALADALDPDPARRPSPAGFAERLGAGIGAFGVAMPNPGALAPVDPAAPTVVSTLPPPEPVAMPKAEPVAMPIATPPSDGPAAEPPPRRTAASPRGVTSRALAPELVRPAGIAIALVVVAVLGLLLLPRLLGDVGVPGSSPGVGATASPGVLASDIAQIVAALDRVDAAIEAARGGKDGLSGRDANDLAQLASTVRDAVQRGDVPAAQAATATLRERVDELGKGLDKDRREALQAAVDELARTLGD